MTKLIATLGIGAALALAAPNVSQAQGPVVTGGLVNLTVVNVLNNNTVDVLHNVGVGVAANVAAQICGTELAVPVGVLAAQAVRQGQATACTIEDQNGQVWNVLIG